MEKGDSPLRVTVVDNAAGESVEEAPAKRDQGAAASSTSQSAEVTTMPAENVKGLTSIQIDGTARRKRDFPRETSSQPELEGAVGGLGHNKNPSRMTPRESCEQPTSRSTLVSPSRHQIPASQILPSFVPCLDDGAEDLLRASFIRHMTKYEGVALPPSEEFEINWVTMECDLDQIVKGGLIPVDSIASSGLDETSYQDFKLCAEELQSNLFEGKLLESLSNLRGFRRLFCRSSDPLLRHAFRGRPLEVLQNIYYGGDGTLPEDRMLLDDPFSCQTNDFDDFMFDD